MTKPWSFSTNLEPNWVEPLQTAQIFAANSSEGVFLSKYPIAPDCSATITYSSSLNVVSNKTLQLGKLLVIALVQLRHP